MNIRKSLTAAGSVLAFAFCLASGSEFTSLATESEITMVATTDVNVRDAAGMHGDILGVLSPDEAVTVTGIYDGWYHVDYKEQSGYVYHQWLIFIGSDENGEVAVGSEIDMYAIKGVNIRKGPGIDHKVIGGLAEDEMVQVTGKIDGWCKVNHDGQAGYVYGQYLDFLASDSRQINTDFDDEFTEKTMTVNCRAGVNVRNAPTEAGDIIDGLEKGSFVTVVGLEDGWYQVTYDDITGYIYRQWLSDVVLDMVMADTSRQGEILTTTVDLNLRANSSLEGDILTTMPAGSTVTIVAQEGKWYVVDYDGIIGAAYGKYLK